MTSIDHNSNNNNTSNTNNHQSMHDNSSSCSTSERQQAELSLASSLALVNENENDREDESFASRDRDGTRDGTGNINGNNNNNRGGNENGYHRRSRSQDNHRTNGGSMFTASRQLERTKLKQSKSTSSKSKRNTYDNDKKGVNQHNYSPESIRRIMERQFVEQENSRNAPSSPGGRSGAGAGSAYDASELYNRINVLGTLTTAANGGSTGYGAGFGYGISASHGGHHADTSDYGVHPALYHRYLQQQKMEAARNASLAAATGTSTGTGTGTSNGNDNDPNSTSLISNESHVHAQMASYSTPPIASSEYSYSHSHHSDNQDCTPNDCTNECSGLARIGDCTNAGVTNGLLDSTKRWLQAQKNKRQRQALEKAVEEQRRVLLRQTLKSERERIAMQSSSSTIQAAEKKERERQRAERGNHGMYNPHSGLDSNATFRNLTQPSTTKIMAGFCGSPFTNGHELEEEEYTADYSEEDNENSSIGDYETAVQSVRSSDLWSCSVRDDFTTMSINSQKQMTSNDVDVDDQDMFKIGSPCHTLSGQGMAVQLEIVERPPKSKKWPEPPKSDEIDVNIQNERNKVAFILNKEQMRDIANNGLPASIMFAKWKRLYCLQRDGDSFVGAFLKKVARESRTLLVIQTTNGEIMGAYSSSPWENQSGSVGAAFYGSCEASLFKIQKDTKEVIVYKWSGANRYIQVCDVHAKLLAMGGGGKEGTFGLCIEDDFRIGTTGTCETFANEPLCEEERFEIMNLEVWGFLPGFC